MLKYGGGAAVLLGGGYLAYSEFLAGGGPKSVVRGYINAVESGDAEEARSYVHSQATFSPSVSNSGTASISINSLSQEDDPTGSGAGGTTPAPDAPERTYVIADVTVEFQMNGETQSSNSQILYELRKEDGEWKIYSENTMNTGGF